MSKKRMFEAGCSVLVAISSDCSTKHSRIELHCWQRSVFAKALQYTSFGMGCTVTAVQVNSAFYCRWDGKKHVSLMAMGECCAYSSLPAYSNFRFAAWPTSCDMVLTNFHLDDTVKVLSWCYYYYYYEL